MAQRRRTRDRRRSRPQQPLDVTPPPVSQHARTTRARPSPSRNALVDAVWTHRFAVGVGSAIVLASLALYVATAARDIVFGDTPELTAVALTFGVAHPPGYPVFTMLGWLFGQIPVGPLPFRVALLSAVCHAATVGVVYGATYRFSRSVPAAAAAAAALAFEPLFWYWSLVAEVFPLSDLLSATMLLLVALWHEHPERKRLLIAGGLVGGLGMANQQTIALLSPAVFYVVWRRRDVLLGDPRIVLKTAIAFVAGLTPYLELLIAAGRHPALSWGDLQAPADLVGHILRTSYGTTSLIIDPKFAGGSPIDRLMAFSTSFDPVQWLLIAAGTAYAWRVRHWYVTYLLIAFVVAGPLFVAYSNANAGDETARAVLERFFLLPQVAVAPLAGFGVTLAADLSKRIALPRHAVEMGAATLAVVAALAFVPLYYRQVDQSDNHVARTFAEDLLSTIKPHAIFLASGDPVVFPLWYLQAVEGARPDVTVVGLPLVPVDWYVRELRRAHPDLVLKYDTYGPGGAPTRALIDDNRGRTIEALGDLPDNSTVGVYWFYPRGLIYEVKPLSEKVLVDDMAAENKKILATYHPPRYADLVGPFRSWERLVLVDYAQGYSRVAKQLETGADSIRDKHPRQAADLYARAQRWYRRALDVNPTLAEAKQGLERTSR